MKSCNPDTGNTGPRSRDEAIKEMAQQFALEPRLVKDVTEAIRLSFRIRAASQ